MGVFKYLRDKAYVTYHLHRLASENMDSRDKSVYALEEVGFPAVPALVDALRNADPRVREGAACALGDIAGKNPGNAMIVDVVPSLIEALKDEDSEVRWGAVFALGTIADNNPGNAEFVNIVHMLVGAIKDWEPGVRRNAACQLGEIANANPGAVDVIVPVLVEALKDESPDVRGEAAWALGKIVDKCDTLESLKMLEEKLMECAASLRKGSQSRDDVQDAMLAIGGIMNKVAARKNELAGMAMENDGLMLAGERPKPPKRDGGMYQVIGRAGAITNG